MVKKVLPALLLAACLAPHRADLTGKYEVTSAANHRVQASMEAGDKWGKYLQTSYSTSEEPLTSSTEIGVTYTTDGLRLNGGAVLTHELAPGISIGLKAGEKYRLDLQHTHATKDFSSKARLETHVDDYFLLAGAGVDNEGTNLELGGGVNFSGFSLACGYRHREETESIPGLFCYVEGSHSQKPPETASTKRMRKMYKKYESAIQKASKKHDIEESLILGVMKVESNGNRIAVSYCGAAGLMQLMPGTAKKMGLKKTYEDAEFYKCNREYGKRLQEDAAAKDDRFNSARNIDAGTKYLRFLFNRYENVARVLGGYHGSMKQSYIDKVLEYKQVADQVVTPNFRGR